ncbi:fumarylacetoacetate hydrolase family protein [Nitrospirillum sp. BR 11163]|uniref:fumarylacetoacetate hydrolase family protein n=1 Tax=Nitrospirillum sp. BR 11163 TaxID=3104323 RepID=UPI002AFEC4AF|nr:fumarylacetoacetate hydrolase family protein [Nitrospirillum sp. BR 11163]MEA1673707.1 fumarylacetoacetate hydrolase family protein [Nitrospirillum sp. BR 11163]
MKLATYKSVDSRDGRLVVVSRDLARAVDAGGIVPTLQAALDRWDAVAPRLAALSDALDAGEVNGTFPFDQAQAESPLPRAYQWLDGSSYLAHGRLLDRAFNIPPIPQADVIPIMYQGGSDDFLPPRGEASFVSDEDGIDFEAEFAIVVGDVPMGADEATARDAVRLVMLANDWSLRALQPWEMKRGFGLIHAKPSTAFAPVAVTPDELGGAWRDGLVDLRVLTAWNGKMFGRPSGGAMDYRYGQLVTHAARTRRLRAGTIIGFGTTSEGQPDKVGSACITERRGYEIIQEGAPKTPFMKFGDTVSIEVLGADGRSVFGRIDQRVVKARV